MKYNQQIAYIKKFGWSEETIKRTYLAPDGEKVIELTSDLVLELSGNSIDFYESLSQYSEIHGNIGDASSRFFFTKVYK